MLINRTLFSLLCCLLIFSVTASAQTTTGSIRGTVTDTDGQPVPGAAVKITSTALIGGTRTAYTNDLGVFRFPSLPVGSYAVEVTMEGFETVQAQDVSVSLDSTANLPFTMKLTSVQEAVTVMGETPLLDITESGTSTNYKEEMLREVPTQRNMSDLIQVSPGMTTTYGDSQSTRTAAFGSNTQSNSWNIDGLETSGPETGSSWWEVNLDAVEEIQVIGVGAPAEYGNHTGAVFNVVTKKGSDNFHGSGNFFFFNDEMVDEHVVVGGFPYHQETYRDVVLQLGGPIVKNRAWFFGAFEHLRDGNTQPGADPSFTPIGKSDNYDIKGTVALGEKYQVNGFWHSDEWDSPGVPTPFVTPSALSGERGSNPAWGGGVTATLTQNFLFESNYAGWWSDDIHDSATGSFEDPFIDYTPPGGGTTYSGGVYYPWDYVTWRHQFNTKGTYYADQFLNSQHEFKFGVQYSKGSALTNVGIGPNGTYSYNYAGTLYRAEQAPYTYGGESNDLGFFFDDTITVNDHLTLNVGVRFDHNTGKIPDYPRLAIGEPSISPAGNYMETGETIPGVDVVNWNKISPRFGFTYQPRADGKSVIKGSFGVYYDHNVIGNWDSPPPQRPTFNLFQFNPDTQQYELIDSQTPDEFGYDPDLEPPRTLQYSAGYEHQFSDSVAAGVQYVYKDTQNLVGWEILGGTWEQVPFVDPFTGTTYSILSQVDAPLLRKGNDPGDFPGSEDLDYFQKYHGVVLTLDKRFSNRWGLNLSYTWSESTGLIPRMLSQYQFNPFYSSREGSDPNNFINAEGKLQGDRPHMFRAQAVFFRLPWDLNFSTAVEFSSGRHHNRLIQVSDLGQGTATVIMERGFRFSPVQNIDVTIGKIFAIGESVQLRFDGTVYNVLNSDTEIEFNSLSLQSTDETFIPDWWFKPRRLMIRGGIQF